MTVQRTILVGSLWAIGMRWGVRLLGAVSVVVLARLLRPEDFGIMTMSMLVVGAMSTFGELGVGSMVIREHRVSSSDLDTAWTLKAIQGLVIAGLVASLAPLTASHFHEPRVTDVVYLGAVAVAIGAFENIGVVLLRKNLDFAADFRYQLSTKLAGALITIALAVWLRSYWALALAQPITAAAGVVISYLVSAIRPRFGLSSWRRYLGFSINMLFSNIARFGYNKLDVFVVGSIGTASQMGLYNVAAELSSMAPRELTSSVGRALYPSLAQEHRNHGSFAPTFLSVVEWVAALCIPIGVGLWVVAPDAVRTILGARWEAATPLMRFLAIYGMTSSLVDLMLGQVLLVTGHERRQTAFFWVRLAVVAICVAVGARHGVEGIAMWVMIGGFAMLAVGIGVLATTLRLRLDGFIKIFWRPTFAAVAMAVVVQPLTSIAAPPAARLALCVVAGAIVYGATMFATWRLAGRPSGIEYTLLGLMARHRGAR